MSAAAIAIMFAFRIAALSELALALNEALHGPFYEYLPLGGSLLAQFGILFTITFVLVELVVGVHELKKKRRRHSK